MDKAAQTERILELLDNINNNNSLVQESKYKARLNEQCNYCSKKPIKIWNYKNKIIKVCKKCCKIYKKK